GVIALADSPKIIVLEINGVINPPLQDYIARGIEKAEIEQAAAVIIKMDTPGGLDSTMREIIKTMNESDVPVIVFIPSGGRAASAGFFITIASDVAVMAPDTAIGAASPIALGSGGEAEVSDTLESKILNDAIAYARAIAEAHGRNADWAESAVRNAASVSAAEALSLNVIDLVEPNLSSVISSLNGFTYIELNGTETILNTEAAEIIELDMSFGESFLYTISNPEIAYILLSLAMLGIMIEILNPGAIFPGVTGAICGLLAFYALGVLPVNFAGVFLMVLAFAFFAAEFFTPSFGIFTAGGLVALIVGSLILFEGGPLFEVNIALIITIALIVTTIAAFIINRVIMAHRRQSATGQEELIGKLASVKTALNPKGTIFYEGEIWQAEITEGSAQPEDEVIIIRVEGLKLFVTNK
ncbi:MAG: nodulation protein NfeD, partial [Chloroflexi bacterium]|nr:nodulation protein NfeD [Chloroflexota bacterium]